MSGASNIYPTAELRARDAAHHMHPFSDTGALNREGVRVITGAEGVWLTDSDGNRYMDGMAGLWCCQVGHGPPNNRGRHWRRDQCCSGRLSGCTPPRPLRPRRRRLTTCRSTSRCRSRPTSIWTCWRGGRARTARTGCRRSRRWRASSSAARLLHRRGLGWPLDLQKAKQQLNIFCRVLAFKIHLSLIQN